jgi:hypothetical protein
MDRPEPGSSEQEYREWIEAGGKLTEEQLEQVSALVQSEFPFAEGADPGEVVERVCWALGELVRARNSGVDEYAKKRNRLAAGEQLRALYQETETEDQFRERMHELGDLARFALCGSYRDEGSGFAKWMAVRFAGASVKGRLPVASSASRSLRAAAYEAARVLQLPVGRGRPPEASAAAFSARFLEIWLNYADPKSPIKPHPKERYESNASWPWKEMAVRLGKVVDPHFGDGASRRVYLLWTADELPFPRLAAAEEPLRSL